MILINPIYADNDDTPIDLTKFPEKLAEALSIPTFAGGILCSLIFVSMWLLALNLLKKVGFLTNLIIGLGLLSFCIAIQWLPYWIMLVICLLIASLWSDKIVKALGK